MSRIAAKRLLASSPSQLISESVAVSRPAISKQCQRLFSQSTRRAQDDEPRLGSMPPSRQRRSSFAGNQNTTARPTNQLSALGNLFQRNQEDRGLNAKGSQYNGESTGVVPETKYEEPHHLHVYSHRHNTHITLTNPDRNPIMSVSCGSIGFRKAGRKTYDAAFQLAAYALGRITEKGYHLSIDQLELTLRGFGQGREAVTKALLGAEGRILRGKIIRVQDDTRLKFGGTRSRKPRRLG